VKSLLPWPSSYLESARWSGVGKLLDRCRHLWRNRSLPGTLMLTGEAGLGREAVAVELAALLTCREDGGPSCGCASCQRVRLGVHPDFEVVDLDVDDKTGERKTEISIRQARRIADNLSSHPYESSHRVIVLVSCHTPPLNEAAASALLKSLEEPPGHVTFLLLASNPARALPTIASRSVLLRVPPPTRDELLDLLAAANGITRPAAVEHLRICLDDAVLAFQTGPGDDSRAVAALGERVGALLAGESLAALQLGALARKTPETMPLVAQALLAAVADPAREAREEALDAAAGLLAAVRRRAVLHLDGESVTVGALVPLLPR
jgi:DNA polymerase-3 subunit delta'